MEARAQEPRAKISRTSTLDSDTTVFHASLLPHSSFYLSNGERRIWEIPTDCIDIMSGCGGII